MREHDEWQAGHLEGSVHIPLMELGERFAELPHRAVLVVCRSGSRSAYATAYLVQQGFDAVNLDGGLVEWAGAGRPLVDRRRPARPGPVADAGPAPSADGQDDGALGSAPTHSLVR